MFDIPFGEVLRGLGPRWSFTIVNGARVPADYYFATLLPERGMPTYHIEDGTMTVRTTMASMVGMDSPYPETGTVELSGFRERCPKFANQVTLKEEQLRRIQEMVAYLRGSNQSAAVKGFVQNEILNVNNKLILQAHWDLMEWARGRALFKGRLQLEQNGISIDMNYGIPSANFLPNRTGVDSYGGSQSKFWADMRTLDDLLRENVRLYLTHPTTMKVILANDANNIELLSREGGVYRIRKLRNLGGNTVASSDPRDVIEIITYGKEGEVADPANPGKTKRIPFCPIGEILAVGNNDGGDYEVGQGATEDPELDMSLGYTHIAPTVEGGAIGRWADQRVPDDKPWQLVSRGVTNGAPVVRAPDKLARASTDI